MKSASRKSGPRGFLAYYFPTAIDGVNSLRLGIHSCRVIPHGREVRLTEDLGQDESRMFPERDIGTRQTTKPRTAGGMMG